MLSKWDSCFRGKFVFKCVSSPPPLLLFLLPFVRRFFCVHGQKCVLGIKTTKLQIWVFWTSQAHYVTYVTWFIVWIILMSGYILDMTMSNCYWEGGIEIWEGGGNWINRLGLLWYLSVKYMTRLMAVLTTMVMKTWCVPFRGWETK